MLLLIFVNDIPSAVKCKLLLYADDSVLTAPGNNTKEIQQELSNELESIKEWLIDNKLSPSAMRRQCLVMSDKGQILRCRT